MTSDAPSFFSVDEVLGGLPARRASTILFAIEGRTAQQVRQAHQAMATFLPAKTAQEQETAFLGALAEGRDLPLKLTIQDLERFAPIWQSLVPQESGVRAAIAHQMGEKYGCSYRDIPSIRAALSLDELAVQESYLRLYSEPIDRLFDAQPSVAERLRWAWSRFANWLENLPPFWSAFSLTLTETVGASILALPIALASLGPLAGVALLLVLGAVNVLTVIGIVEAITRNGNMRYGNAYFGTLVGDYLGKPGRMVLSPALLMLTILLVIAYYIGVSTTLAAATRISAAIWAAPLFLVCLYFLWKQDIGATVASALLVGVSSLAIIVSLSVLALRQADMANLRYINLPTFDQGFDASLLGLVFGVVLAAFFGHTSAGNAAKIVLQRDPTGKALLWGNIAAMVAAILLYSLWVIAVNGAIAPDILIATKGTALVPLTDKLGGIVPILGVIYAVLAMGMAAVHMSLGLFFQVREWLPNRLSSAAKFWVSLVPVVVLFGVIEWLLITNRESFTGLIGFIGVLGVSLLGGIFPVLMLAASRRKGEYVPGQVLAMVGNPMVLGLLYAIYFAGVVVHGLVIFQSPFERIASLGVAALMLGITVIVARQGAFRPRTVIELRQEGEDDQLRGRYAITSAGRISQSQSVRLDYPHKHLNPAPGQGDIPNLNDLRSASFELPESGRELKIWVHRLTAAGSSEPLPASVAIEGGKATTAANGQWLIADQQVHSIKILLQL